ncbi:MAG TPA: DUF1549 domain-containing protein, partial [Gemmataceae bacterium]|nr:DUF1549 domain-containing protein [Gemmataceae bacterium]
MLFIFGGWVGYRALTTARPGATPQAAQPAPVSVAAAPALEKIAAKEQDAPTPAIAAAPKADADEDVWIEPPPVIGTPDPELDKLVEREAAKEPLPKGKVNLAPIAHKASARTPAGVATDLDALIDRKLTEAGIAPSPPADDAEFLRRVYLDIIGVIPSAATTRAFLADSNTDKRARVVDQLFADPQFGENFSHYWHDLLVKRDQDNNRGIKTHDVFLKWMAHQFNNNRPWNEVVRSMLTAQGDQALAGETFFMIANSENGQPAPNKIVGTAAALFLGNQLMCCECHVHPVTPEWKQQDFWGLAAFFGKTRAQRAEKAKNPNDILARITDEAPPPAKKKGPNEKPAGLPDGSIPIPDPRNDGQFIGAAKPKLLGGPVVAKTSVNRNYLADWFVAPTNPFFPRATVNRIWSQFFARGFINPLDDIRPDSEATHPEVLQLLSEELVASKFDVKHLMKCIIASRAYQRSSRTTRQNANDHELYSHMAMKVLPPRSLFRSLAVATNDGLAMLHDDAAPGKKNYGPATGLGFFDVREYDESPGEYTYGVPHLLRLMNSQLPPACDALAKSMVKTGSQSQVIEQLYLQTLSRKPTPAEAKKAGEFIGKQASAEKGYSTL